MKLKEFENFRNKDAGGAYVPNKFCKNGKTKRTYRRRRINAAKRHLDFIETKRRLLAQRSIELPKYMTARKPWTRSTTIS